MSGLIDWIQENWFVISVPIAVFLTAIIATLWLRRLSYRALSERLAHFEWPADEILVRSTRFSSILWCLFISIGLSIAVSQIPAAWKTPISNGLWTLFLVSITLSLLNILNSITMFYGLKLKLPTNVITTFRNVSKITVLIVAVLVVLDIWGIPVTPLLLLIAVLVVTAILALRDIFPNIVAGFQINAANNIKVGDYIKLDTGEEGYVVELDWRSTRLKALDEGTIILPNSRLIHSAVVNYGHPLKKAKQPFHFFSRVHLTELTGLKASNLRELVDILRTAPDTIIYYHTHHFIEEHHYLTPEPSNDFALWIEEALGDEVLAERLASVDTFEFTNLASLRDRLVGIMDEYLLHTTNTRQVVPGREFHFLKSISAILPTPYIAHDLREFAETLRRITSGSIFFHVFESRLRLGKGLNDFTVWLADSLDETELSKEIGRLDPYTYTLEGLRSSLIQLIEKRIK
jgi:small-conductance mechanosensitive channel